MALLFRLITVLVIYGQNCILKHYLVERQSRQRLGSDLGFY